MKTEEMADVLEGLSGVLERLMGKSAVKDLRAVADCFRQFPGENVSTFCNRVSRASVEKPRVPRTKPSPDAAAVNELSRKIMQFKQNLLSSDYALIRQFVDELKALKVVDIRAVGDRVGCAVSGTKAEMVSGIEDWLNNMKGAVDGAAFTLPAVNVS